MKRSPLKRSSIPLKRTPLARLGRKKLAKRAARAEIVCQVHERDGFCRFNKMVDAHSREPWDFPDACYGVSDVHEIVPRSVWPDGDLVLDNCVLLCRSHHSWLDSHRDLAEQIGLYSRIRP